MDLDNPVRAADGAARATRGVLLVALALAVLIVVLMTIGAVASVVDDLASGTVSTALVAERTIPAAGDLVAGSWSSASVSVRPDSPVLVALAVAASAVGLLARIAVAGVLVLTCARVLRAEPFGRRFTLAVGLLGGGVTIGALLEAGLGMFRDLMVLELLGGTAVVTSDAGAQVDLSLVGLGFGVMVLGLLLEHAERLQRATAGLV